MIADSSYCSAFAVTPWWVLWETWRGYINRSKSANFKTPTHCTTAPPISWSSIIQHQLSNRQAINTNLYCPTVLMESHFITWIVQYLPIKVLLRLSINQRQVHNLEQPIDSTATSMCSSVGQWPKCWWSFRIRTLWWPLRNSQNIWRRVTGLAQQWQEPAHCHLD